MLAFGGQDWVSVIIMLSIFVPVTAAIVLVVILARGGKNDPDEQRLRRAQVDYERSRRES